jgi:hypothetical protein
MSSWSVVRLAGKHGAVNCGMVVIQLYSELEPLRCHNKKCENVSNMTQLLQIFPKKITFEGCISEGTSRGKKV